MPTQAEQTERIAEFMGWKKWSPLGRRGPRDDMWVDGAETIMARISWSELDPRNRDPILQRVEELGAEGVFLFYLKMAVFGDAPAVCDRAPVSEDNLWLLFTATMPQIISAIIRMLDKRKEKEDEQAN